MQKAIGENDYAKRSVRGQWAITENGELILAFVLAFFLNAAIRMIEYDAWQADAFFLNGEPLMATHDAYAWLAGAKGIGSYAASRFAAAIRWMHELTGLSLGSIGFWLPVATVPWLALPACLLARALRLTEAGVIFALMAGSSLGYLVRTRLGFCDTDLVSLFFPLAFASALTAWLATQTRSGWKLRAGEKTEAGRWSVGIALLAGCCGTFNVSFYSQGGSLLLAVTGMAVLVTLVLAPNTTRIHVLTGLLMVYAMTFGGGPGWLVGLGLAYVLALRPEIFEFKIALPLIGLLAVLVMVMVGLPEMVLKYLGMISTYAKTHAVDIGSNASSLQLPAITQSVREAQNLNWGQVAGRMAGNWPIFLIGLAGYIFAVTRRPQLLLFVPFLALGLASVKLGNRFAMYGGVALGVGLGFGLAELMRLFGQNQGRRWIVQLVLACFAFWPAGELMRIIQPVPVLPKVYAQTFLNLRAKTEQGARLWQWWDYGYAGQYYAERATFADGGAHDGPWLYPLALVHSAQTPLQASQIMRYVTTLQRENSKEKIPTRYYWANPVGDLRAMGSDNATAFIKRLAEEKMDFPADLPAQYLILSWENLRLGGWISYYGNWDLAAGKANPGKIQQMQGEIRVDANTGTMIADGKAVPVDSLDMLEETGTHHFAWDKGTNVHIIINQLSRQVFLMDAKMYKSMMIQMLIADPRSFAPHFELVEDGYPWTRVYKAR